MSQTTMWEKTKTNSKAGFDKAWAALDKLGGPVNRLSNKLGSEAFWPTTLDKECDKAARILKSFCKDGFYAEEEYQPQEGPKQKQKVLKKIPENVIQNAKGLAIFTTMRTGLWVSGAGGSGILIARKPDGSWSPPSGILLHTAGLGFLVGIDIYDCVVVINNEKALEAFTKVRCTLGSEVSVAAGPVGAGGVLESEVHKRQSPIFTYMKSRGFYAGVQIDGTVIIERWDENERFYGQKLPVKDILAGKVRHPPYEVKRLMETIKAAQGDRDVDVSMLPTEAPPGDYEIEDGHLFGVPDKDDPDPYGVLALEKEGMSLKEAGSKKRASWEEFSFNPSPNSPVHSILARQSGERSRSNSQRSSWRASAFSNDPKTPSSLRNSMDAPHATIVTDAANGASTPKRSSTGSNGHHIQMEDVPEDDELGSTKDSKQPNSMSTVNGITTPPRTPPSRGPPPALPPRQLSKPEPPVEESDIDDADEDAQIIETPTVHSVQTVHSTIQTVNKPRIVNVPKRIPPQLPPRNPQRSGPSAIDMSPEPSPEEANEPKLSADSDHLQARAPEPDVSPLSEKMEDVKLDDDNVQSPVSDLASDRTERVPGRFD